MNGLDWGGQIEMGATAPPPPTDMTGRGGSTRELAGDNEGAKSAAIGHFWWMKCIGNGVYTQIRVCVEAVGVWALACRYPCRL